MTIAEKLAHAAQGATRDSLVRMLPFVRRHWRAVALAYVSLVVVLLTTLAGPELVRLIIDEGIAKSDTSVILWGTLGLIGLAAVRAGFSFLQGYTSELGSQNLAYDLRNELYDKLQSQSFAYHDRTQTGQLMTRVTSDVDQVREFMGTGLLQLTGAVLLLVGTTLILMLMNWQLAVMSVLSLVLLIAIFIRFGSQVRPMFRSVQEERGALNALLQENLAGVRVVKAFAREDYEIRHFGQQNRALTDRMMDLFRLFATRLPVFIAVSAIGTLVVLWYGGTLVIHGALTLGELVAFNTYLLMLMMPVRTLGFLVGMGARASASAQRVLEVLDTPLDIADRPDAVELPPIEGRVCFDHVSFRYHGGTDTLRDVSFEATPGQTVALLGTTGSGKSTIINLIPRFYDVSAGRVTIDDYDVRHVKVESLRRQVGTVLQSTALFSGTIRENIAYGCPEANDASLMAAAQAAEIGSFIEGLPQKYDTPVGERGVTLSGGQRQRIAIARALLLDPKILIMDDATSSVDVETEYQIQRALARLMAGRTSFVIAQRVSTVQNADLILVLDHGSIVARGTHEELLRESSLYAELYDLQLGADLTAEQETAGERGMPSSWPTPSVLEGRWM